MKEKIKFVEFNLLNLEAKQEIIIKEGWLVTTEKTKTRVKTLYQINDFYTQVTIDSLGIKSIKPVNVKTSKKWSINKETIK
jgi:hypothetical protein